MTGPENDPNSTRPISVAELLAKNGNIGSPPVGGRRRRRRGNNDSVTVAELTGEIPIIRTGEIPLLGQDLDDDDKADDAAHGPRDHDEPRRPEQLPAQERPGAPAPSPAQPNASRSGANLSSPAMPRTNGSNGAAPVRADRAAAKSPIHEPEAPPQGRRAPESTAKPELAPAPWARRGREPGPERSQYPRPLRNAEPLAAQRNAGSERAVGAEQMVPDPYYDPSDAADDVLDDDVLDDDAGVFGAADSGSNLAGPDIDDDGLDLAGQHVGDDASDAKYLQSYLRSSNSTLFSGETVADDLARRGPKSKRTSPVAADSDLMEEAEAADVFDEDYDDHDSEGPSRGALAMHGVWVVLQSILAVAFGAGLFIAFDQLWKWNNIVALVLSVLVILGLVVGVRVVRKTEDIASTLIAVAVGALVTLGPLALLQSN